MVATLGTAERIAATIAALLALVWFYEVLVPVTVPPTPVFSSPPLAVAQFSAPSVSLPSENAFAAISDKPLFAPTRTRPAPVAAKPEAAAPPPPPNAYLVGVISDSAGSLALVRSTDSPLETSLREGQTLGGWQIAKILPDRMILSSGPNQHEIRLNAPHPMDAAPKPDQPPPPAH